MTSYASRLAGLAPPEHSFASDTTAPALPAVLRAVEAANAGHVASYGADPLTREVIARFRHLVGDPEVTVRLCTSGTGANVLATALSGLPRVVLAEQSHMAADEEDAPFVATGAVPITLPAPHGLLGLAAVEAALDAPALVSVTQASEDGTTYALDDLRGFADAAHAAGGALMIDGARLAHAIAAQGVSLAEVWATGVDQLVVGGTKTGMLGAEAVLSRGGDPAWWRRSGQLPSKTRFVAAQWAAVLPDGWLTAAAAANARAQQLFEALRGGGLEPAHRVDISLVFVDLDAEAAQALAAWTPLALWGDTGRVRLSCSWDTTDEDVTRLAAGVLTLT